MRTLSVEGCWRVTDVKADGRTDYRAMSERAFALALKKELDGDLAGAARWLDKAVDYEAKAKELGQ